MWDAALGVLQLEVPKADFAAWFRDTHFVSGSDDEVVIGVPTVFAKETVERKYLPLVSKALLKASGRDVSVTFVVRPSERDALPSLLPPGPAAPGPAGSAPRTAGLQPRLTFESFVVGASNRLAHAAAQRTGESPGRAYNPLFIYSGVGLGKTHLMHAIGHAILARDPTTRVRYTTCETFTNDLLVAIRTDVRGDRRRKFRERYRNIDVLLVDDVEFLRRSEASQEELFHTFNALYEADGQIVLASDRPPGELGYLADRLRSRFEAGLVADIQAPDLDLRRALLERQAALIQSAVPADVIDYLADRVRRNVRELEGALTRTLIYAELNGLECSLQTAAQALDGLGLASADGPPSPDRIVETTSGYFSLSPDDLRGPRRDARVVRPRQIAMYLLRDDARLTLPEIGRLLGGRDHTTVLHGHKKTGRQIQLDDKLRRDIDEIRARLAHSP